MALTIGYDATPAVRQAAGIGRYARSLLGALASRRDDILFRVYALAGGETNGHMPPLDSRFRYRRLPVSDRVMNGVWQRARIPLPVQLLSGSFDVFHSPDFSLPPVANRPSILTIHDLAFFKVPECAYPSLRSYLQDVVPRAVHRATRIIAVSEQTRIDLMEQLGVPAERISKVLEGVGDEFRPLDRDAAREGARGLGVDKPFILSVGTIEPRKNYVRLFQAFSQLVAAGIDHDLVIAGRPGWLYDSIYERVAELHLQERVKFIVPDDLSLVQIYNAADVFVYPSLYEGFGIPPLEALACGTPVATSRVSSLPEVVGEGGLFFDPLSPEEIAGAIQTLLDDEELRARLRTKGLQRAAELTWAKAAEQTVRIYEEVAHG